MTDPAESWVTPAAPPPLGTSEVHVWRARLDPPAGALRQFGTLLSPDESARAERFRFPIHRNRYVARRGTLRMLLGMLLQAEPASVAFDYTQYGKPSLARRHRRDLRFNLSFSGDLALYAFALDRDLGVDVERIRVETSEETVAEQFFAPAEVKRLRAAPRATQPAAFFDCWARKEAYVKARGLGLSLALDSFEVSFGDGGPARLLRTAPDSDDAARWTLAALYPAPEHAAALAVEGGDWALRCWNWPPAGGPGGALPG